VGIAANWQEVERWLSAHAPKVLAHLPKGASESDLAHAEKFMRLALPRDLRESLAIHDGNARTFILYGPNESVFGTLLSLHEIVLAWRSLKSLFAGRKAGSAKGVKPFWWHRKWVPALGGFGDHTGIDLDPDRGGKLGQVFDWAHDGGVLGVVAPSYGALFARFVRELKEGRYRYLSTSPWGHARLDRKKPILPKELRVKVVAEYFFAIMRVRRDANGKWKFLCAAEHEGLGKPTLEIVTLGDLVQRDPTLKPVLDLEPGWEAVRKKYGGRWVRKTLQRE
jgi:cell wall assembly regulator SMI1